MRRHLERADRHAGLDRRLLEAQLAKLQEADDALLPGRQRGDRAMQPANVEGALGGARRGTDGLQTVERLRQGRAPRALAQPVDELPAGDGDEPRTERPAGIVGPPHRVQRQERILHGVLDIGGLAQPARGARPQIGRDLPEQPRIGGAIAILGARHQRRPVRALRRHRRRCFLRPLLDPHAASPRPPCRPPLMA